MYDVVPRNYWTAIREDEGRLKVIGTQPWAEASKMLHLEAGKKYRLRYNADLGNCAYLHIIVANPADGSYVWVPATGGITTGGNYSGTFTAAADNLEIRFQMPALPTGESTGYFYLDDIYLEEVVEYEEVESENGGRYRYQFNGKELDREVSGTTTYDYGFRIYSPALGKFLSVDPLMKRYPFFTPYQFASNMPIAAADLDGLESIIKVSYTFNFDGALSPLHASIIETQSERNIKAAMTNFILPGLDLPDEFKNGENRYLIKETIINSLSINFTESFHTNSDGSKQTIITAIGDIDYEKLFGDKKQEAVKAIGNALDFASASSDALSLESLGPEMEFGSRALKFGSYGIKALNGEYGALGQEVLGDATTGILGWVAKQGATQLGASIAVAGTVSTYASSVVGFLMIPSNANAPGSISNYLRDRERVDVREKTLSSLMFKFMRNNISTDIPSISNLETSKSDNTRIKLETLNLPNLPHEE